MDTDFEEILVPHLGWLRYPPGDEVALYLREGWFEYREQAFFWLYLRENDVVVDCGAHAGLYSALAWLAMNREGRVFALEPNPRTLPLLEANLGAFGIAAGSIIAAAVHSTPGTAKFYPRTSQKSAFSAMVPEILGSEEVDIRTTTIGEVCKSLGLGRVDLLKIDTEGSEVDVLKGAAESAAAGILPLIMIEFTELNLRAFGLQTSDLVAQIEGMGYMICRFDHQRGVLTPQPVDGPIWYDNLFLTKDVEGVNARLRSAPGWRVRIAHDILARGEVCHRLRFNNERAAPAAAQTAATPVETPVETP